MKTKNALSFVLFICILQLFSSCGEDTDLTSLLSGKWQQEQVFIDGNLQTLSSEELSVRLNMESNGVYQLQDATSGKTHRGTWLFSDGDWLNMSMDKIQGVNADNSLRFGQVLVRFTILNVDEKLLELRIKTFLFERKQTVMFTLEPQDNTLGMSGEELLALDTENKKLHTYRYIFKKIEP
jgi:hypothetical protein